MERRNIKCKIDGTEKNFIINYSESFQDFSAQILNNENCRQCRNFLAFYENKGKEEKKLVSTESDFKSYLKMTKNNSRLPLTIKLIMEEERTNKTLLESENVLISEEKKNVRSNNFISSRPKTIEENNEEEMKNENDGKSFPSTSSSKTYAESGDMEEKKNTKGKSTEEKQDAKKKEINLTKQTFSINDNNAQSEEGEEDALSEKEEVADNNLKLKVESDGKGENKSEINKLDEDKGEKESIFKQNFSLNDNYAESQEEGEEVEIQNLSKENTIAMEKEKKGENCNTESRNFESDGENQEKSSKNDSQEKESYPKKLFSLNDNNAQSEEGEEIEIDDNLMQDFSTKNHAGQLEKKEIIKNHPIEFLDEKMEIVKKDEDKEVNVSPKQANNSSLPARTKIRAWFKFKDNFLDIISINSYFSFNEIIKKKFNLQFFKAIYENSKKNQISISSESEFKEFLEYVINHSKKNSKKIIELQITDIREIEQFSQNLLNSKPLNEESYVDKNFKSLSVIYENEDYPRSNTLLSKNTNVFANIEIEDRNENVDDLNKNIEECVNKKDQNFITGNSSSNEENQSIEKNDFKNNKIIQKEINCINYEEENKNQKKKIKDFLPKQYSFEPFKKKTNSHEVCSSIENRHDLEVIKNKTKEGEGKEIEEFMKEKLKEMMDNIYLPMIFEKTDLICKDVFTKFFNKRNVDHNLKPDVKCDVCGKHPIFGERYKCLICKEHDLCFDCEKNYFDDNHVFAKIKNSNQEKIFEKHIRMDYPK